MSVIVLFVTWLFVVAGLLWASRRIFPSTYRKGGYGRFAVIMARSLALACALTPTIVSAGITGFPAPASFVLFAFFLQKGPGTEGVFDNARFALYCLSAGWLAVAVVYALVVSERKRPNQSVQPTPGSGTARAPNEVLKAHFRIRNRLLHASRQLPSWLTSDVRHCSDTPRGRHLHDAGRSRRVPFDY
jgi:hypothetical protein